MKSIVLGITGGIGAGKSYVSAMLERRFDIPVYDCDTRAKQLSNEDMEIRRELTELVGTGVYDENGLVKPKLAAYLFASEDNANHVNSIIHPAVKKDIIQWVASREEKILAVESAILYESGIDELTDYVLYVDASYKTRVARAVERDSSSASQVEDRIRMQNTSAARNKADFLLLNEGQDDAELEKEINKIITNLIQI